MFHKKSALNFSFLSVEIENKCFVENCSKCDIDQPSCQECQAVFNLTKDYQCGELLF